MSYRTETVTSADGTAIAYRAYGDAARPGVVLIHGGMQAAQSFDQLAAALAARFAVYVPNRRGRGGSGPFGAGYGLDTERADVAALLAHTGARRVFGLSSGALIALHSAVELPAIERLALYEPPLTLDGAEPASWAARFERELDRGHRAGAMAAAIQATADMGVMRYLPQPLLRALFGVFLRAERPVPGRVTIGELVPLMRYDLVLAREATRLNARIAELAERGRRVLLMSGDRSMRALQVITDGLARRLPRAERAVIRGEGHIAADDHGRPLEVARVLGDFFAAAPAPN